MKKRFLTTALILLSIIQINCFGKFAITQKLYGFVDGISLSGSDKLVTKFLQTVIMWAGFIFWVAGIGFFLDLFIFNLIEFWTGDNLIGANGEDSKSDKSISAGKTVYFKGNNGEISSISKSLNGKELRFKSFDGKETKEILAYKDEPGKLFTVVDNKIQPIEVEIVDGEIQRIFSGKIQIPVTQN